MADQNRHEEHETRPAGIAVPLVFDPPATIVESLPVVDVSKPEKLPEIRSVKKRARAAGQFELSTLLLISVLAFVGMGMLCLHIGIGLYVATVSLLGAARVGAIAEQRRQTGRRLSTDDKLIVFFSTISFIHLMLFVFVFATAASGGVISATIALLREFTSSPTPEWHEEASIGIVAVVGGIVACIATTRWMRAW